jgi:hypothetical protein
MKSKAIILAVSFMILFSGVLFVSSKYANAEHYLGEGYNQIQETLQQINILIELQPSEDTFWIIEKDELSLGTDNLNRNIIRIVKQIEKSYYNETSGKNETFLQNETIRLLVVEEGLEETIKDSRWIEIRGLLLDMQEDISSTQTLINEYNSMQSQLTSMAGYVDEDNEKQEIKFFNMNTEALQWTEQEIVDSYVNENGLGGSEVSISDVVQAGYVMAGIPISGVSEEFRTLANELRDKDTDEISPAFLVMKNEFNEIASKANGIYGEEIISLLD